jgi:N-methylhydantoinase B
MDEVDAAIVRTAFSTIVGESRDFGCVMMDAGGHSLAQSQLSSPPFTVMLPRTTKHAISVFKDRVEPGDVFIQNDPWVGTGHLPDLSIITPVFHRGALLAFIATAAHVADIGGRMDFFDARDLYEEGLRIPFAKIVKAGKPNDELMAIIGANVRVPDMVLGDVRAIIGANAVGAQGLTAFLHEYGPEAFQYLGEQILSRSEQAMRDALTELPDGVYAYEHVIDGYMTPVTIKVAVTIKGDAMHIDFTGTSPQSRYAINCTESATTADTVYPMKCSLAPHIPNNEGLYRPITLHAPKGCILNATFPSSVRARSKTSMQINSAIYGALAQAMPGRVQAGSGGFWAVHVNGVDPRGEPLNASILPWGGKGAVDGMDGHPTMPFPTNGTVTPSEIVENHVPLIFRYKRLLMDSGGPGKYRGGLGQEISLRCTSDYPLYVGVRPDKIKYPPPGVRGGTSGTPGSFEINGVVGDYQTPLPAAFKAGDELIMRLPGAGGYGNPGERDPARVARDVLLGFVSSQRAEELYRVALCADGSVDEPRTRALREPQLRTDSSSGDDGCGSSRKP